MRIESFRQLMECPSDEILNQVVDVLHNETVNQGGTSVQVACIFKCPRRTGSRYWFILPALTT